MSTNSGPSVDARLEGDSLADRLARVLIQDIQDGVFSQDIQDGDLGSGKLLSMRELASRYGVSRTPLREACRRLAETGFLTIESNRGIVVREKPKGDDITDIFQIRLILEVSASYQAATRAGTDALKKLEEELARMRTADAPGRRPEFMRYDTEFHEHVLMAAGNERLANMVRKLREAAVTGGMLTKRSTRVLIEQHEDILAAMRDRDAAGAAKAMYLHLWDTGRTIRSEMLGTPKDATPDDSSWTAGFNGQAWRDYLDRKVAMDVPAVEC